VGRATQDAGADAGAPIAERPTLGYHEPAHCTQTSEGRDDGMSDVKTLNVGDAAPDFTLKTIGLKEITLRDYRGRNVVVLFYPLDWTPG
jgi:hypothetical protein